MKKGQDRHDDSLQYEIKATMIPDNAVGIWYLGQEGFLLKTDKTCILIDPYLTDYIDRLPEFEKGFWTRKYDSPLKPEQLDFVDFVLCTHEHYDHMDPDTISAILSVNNKVKFIAPLPSLPILTGLNIEDNRAVGAKAGVMLKLNDITVSPVAAAHTDFHQDVDGDYAELSYILTIDGINIFHGGDMSIYPQLPEILKRHDIDIAMIPINGGDRLRTSQGIVGNTGFKEAIDLSDFIGADILIPMHYDLYSVNGENPALFIEYIARTYPKNKYHIFSPGEKIIYYKAKVKTYE